MLRTTPGVIAAVTTYDVYGYAAQAGNMAAYLNSISNAYFGKSVFFSFLFILFFLLTAFYFVCLLVIIVTADEPANNRLSGGLATAIINCGRW